MISQDRKKTPLSVTLKIAEQFGHVPRISSSPVGKGNNRFLVVLWASQLGAHEAVEADSFFSGFDRESAVDFRRNPDDEFSAV